MSNSPKIQIQTIDLLPNNKVCKIRSEGCILTGPPDKFEGYVCSPCFIKKQKSEYQKNKVHIKNQVDMAYGIKHDNFNPKMSLMENQVYHYLCAKIKAGAVENDILKMFRQTLELKYNQK